MSQFLWFKKYILIKKQCFLFPTMSNNSLNLVGQLLDNNGEIKDWEIIKLQFNLENKFYSSWMQTIDSIPDLGKYILWITKATQQVSVFSTIPSQKRSNLCN